MRLYYRNQLNAVGQKLRNAGILSEVILWNELKKDKLGHRFLRQRPSGNYIVDFYCHSLSLAVEIDGAASHDNKIEKDKRRQKILEAMGIKVIRFNDKDVRYNLGSVVEAIKLEILRRVNSPPPLQKEE